MSPHGDIIKVARHTPTKNASDRPTVALSGMGGYMPILGGRSLVETTGTSGQRFGSSKRFGLLIGGSYDWNGRGIDDIEPVSDLSTFPNGSTTRTQDSIDIRDYRYYRSRWGLAGSADYKLGDGSIYVRGLYSDFKNYGDFWVYSLADNTPFFNSLNPSQFPNAPTILGSNGCSVDPTTTLETCGAGTPSFFVADRRHDFALGSLLIGGKHVLASTWYLGTSLLPVHVIPRLAKGKQISQAL